MRRLSLRLLLHLPLLGLWPGRALAGRRRKRSNLRLRTSLPRSTRRWLQGTGLSMEPSSHQPCLHANASFRPSVHSSACPAALTSPRAISHAQRGAMRVSTRPAWCLWRHGPNFDSGLGRGARCAQATNHGPHGRAHGHTGALCEHDVIWCAFGEILCAPTCCSRLQLQQATRAHAMPRRVYRRFTDTSWQVLPHAQPHVRHPGFCVPPH